MITLADLVERSPKYFMSGERMGALDLLGTGPDLPGCRSPTRYMFVAREKGLDVLFLRHGHISIPKNVPTRMRFGIVDFDWNHLVAFPILTKITI